MQCHVKNHVEVTVKLIDDAYRFLIFLIVQYSKKKQTFCLFMKKILSQRGSFCFKKEGNCLLVF